MTDNLKSSRRYEFSDGTGVDFELFLGWFSKASSCQKMLNILLGFTSSTFYGPHTWQTIWSIVEDMS